MSHTRHHSLRWGRLHRYSQSRQDRGWIGPRKDAGEAPGWHVRLYDERPGRRVDAVLLQRVAYGFADADAVQFRRMGNRKPHLYYW